METEIVIRGAREHNLKNINLRLPRNRFIVITGLSGSGKSSLAFDTIYAEGQRRYVESLSSYARLFLEKLKKPEVDLISGLSPAISIEQKHFTHNPRSTVATVTEIYDYLRLLYSKLGTVHCHLCGRKLGKQSISGMIEQIFSLPAGHEFSIVSPLVRGRKGEYRKLFEDLRKKGFSRVMVDGTLWDLSREIKIPKGKRHDIALLIDTLRVGSPYRQRIESSLRTALEFGKGTCVVRSKSPERRKVREILFSERLNCPSCEVSLGELAPNMFSFNSPYGACQRCRGLGKVSQVLSQTLIVDDSKPILRGAINEKIYFSFNKYVIEELIEELKDYYAFDLATPYRALPQEVRDAFLWGNDEISGLLEELKELFYRTNSEEIKSKVKQFLRESLCPDCRGGRLRREVHGVRINGRNIMEVCCLTVQEAKAFFGQLSFSGREENIAKLILKEVTSRIQFLSNVGLDYLTLDRTVGTLGGGELQRVRLARQIGVGLTGVLYVLDEPSIGLHPRDHQKLLETLRGLCRMKNTVIVVEHDEETIRSADFLVDLGPGAGSQGGEVVATGALAELAKAENSLTGKYLERKLEIRVPQIRKDYLKAESIRVRGAQEHNLKGMDVDFPLGLFTCVTGVSGSGKSTLIHDILFKGLHNKLWKTQYPTGKHKGIEGAERIDKVIEMDQSPIGRTPRSNPVTYTDLFVHIRKLFSQAPEARMRSFGPGRFSFNLKGGRCEACRGEGTQRLSMSFLADLYVVCEICRGKRYNEPTLEITYHGRNIAEVLELSVTEALELFRHIPPIREKLSVLEQIGLGYIKCGQPSTTLSGGEAQRVKLAGELGKRSTGRTFYLLDEPTTGLHFADIENLLKALFALRDMGNTIVVVEHNLEVIKMADCVIDLGPEGGEEGGRIVARGTPEEVARNSRSYTGQYLKRYFSKADDLVSLKG